LPSALGLGVAADHKFLLLEQFEFDPIATAQPNLVNGILPFTDPSKPSSRACSRSDAASFPKAPEYRITPGGLLSSHLKPQVVVQPGSIMVLDDKRVLQPFDDFGFRLRGCFEITLTSVFLE
jgi:hypothetical protein